jgi:RNA polymerase sigma-70 factor (ECF subfamily)
VNGKTGKEQRTEKLAQFDAIVSEYQGALLRYAARLVRQHDAAQNIVQDVFIKLFKCWNEELQPSPRILNWLYRVTHNYAVDHIRNEERRHLLHLRHAKECDDFVPPDRGQGFAISDDAERAGAVMKTLSVREQELVILKVYEERSYQEIGEITGLTVGNVGYILHHAMKKLAAELKKMEKA